MKQRSGEFRGAVDCALPRLRSGQGRPGGPLRAVTALALVAGLAGASAEAPAQDADVQAGSVGRFTLSKGGQYTLCRDFAENLRLLEPLPEDACNIPIDPRFTDFREIRWESLEPAENLDLLREIVIRIADRTGDLDEEGQRRVWEEQRPALMQRIDAGDVELGRAAFDLNHDGTRDTVYRYGRYPCTVPDTERRRSFFWSYHVLQGDLGRKLRNYSWRGYHAFYHRGRAYLAEFLPQHGMLVIEPAATRGGYGLSMLPVCEFDYHD